MAYYLNTHTYYSLRYGTLSIEGLVQQARQRGADAVAVTDINNTSAIPDFVLTARKYGIKPLVGIEFRNGDRKLYTAIARNNAGFQELNEFLSHYRLRKKALPEYPPEFSDAYIIYPLGRKKPADLREKERVGVRPREINRLISPAFKRNSEQLVVWQPVTFGSIQEYELHRHLRAIDHNILLSQLQPYQLAGKDEMMMPKDELLAAYRDYPRIIKNTEKLVRDCTVDFTFRTPKNKQTFTGSYADDKALLQKLAYDGLSARYGNHRQARERVMHELQVIFNLGFAAYFLIAWDIVRYSMSRGFRHVGRGSGANSVVAYCLYITDVDPIELNLYFERFINPKRTSPPDFDIDYAWNQREEVQDYIFKRYGRKHTALLGAMSTFKGRSIYRELGKVYGLPKEEIDRFIRQPGHELAQNSITRKMQHIGRMMQDFPNQRSIHAGGILISEEPITAYTALDMPPKSYPVTQWDMYVAEDLGFEKYDILSQRGIGHINDAVEIIRKNKNAEVDIRQLDTIKQDRQARNLLKNGEATGCFYIESPAMRGLLRKLQCNDYPTLVAASSIVRPGVSRSGMMKEYIHRHRHPGRFRYAHSVMREQLEETYGVMVYQEDVLKVGHHFAGLDLADADILRRAMSGKYRSKEEFQRIREKFFANCRQRGYSEKLTGEVWRQIESFAGYSFSKAHSASFAVESFQSLYLKAHYPLEFLVAVINNFGGFYHTWVYVHEARRYGARIELPDVRQSGILTTISGTTIYLGLAHIAKLEYETAERIVNERQYRGNYKTLADFAARVKPGLEQLLILVRTGAFCFTGKSKARLLWEAHLVANGRREQEVQAELFKLQEKEYKLPSMPQNWLEDAYDEIEIIGFTVTVSYFDLLQTRFRGEVMAQDMHRYDGKTVRMAGLLVTTKPTRTSKGERMFFGTFLDARGRFFDTVHFPDSLRKYNFIGDGIYLILGTVTLEFGMPGLRVQKMAKLPIQPDPRAPE